MRLNRFSSLAVGVCAGLALLAVAANAAEETVSADQPVLGFVLDSKAGGLRPVLGVAESPRFGEIVTAPEGVSILALAPGHDWALSTRAVDDRVETGAFVIATGSFVRIADGLVTRFAFSPSGRDVLLTTGSVAAYTGLPGSPKQSLAAAGADEALALSDGGRIAIVRANGRIEAVSDSGRAYLSGAEESTALAFVPSGDALLAYNRQTASLVQFDDPLASASMRVLAAELDGMDWLAAGRAEITLARSAGGVVILNREGVKLRSLDSPPVKGLGAMRLPSLRLLSSEAGEPAWLLSATGISGVPAVREVVE